MKKEQLVCKVFVILTSIAVIAMFDLPLMSVYSGGGEGCTLYVRGFSLMTFRAWGIVPPIAAFLIPIIALGRYRELTKEVMLLTLFTGTMVSYVHSFNAARDWLHEVGDTMITYYPAASLIPIGFAVVLVATKAVHAAEQKYCTGEVGD